MRNVNWRSVEGTQTKKPMAVDMESSPTTVYLRRNISAGTRTDDEGNSIDIWTYDEATMTYEEFQRYSAEAIFQIQEDNLSMMAAQAEIYEAIQEIAGGGVTNG